MASRTLLCAVGLAIASFSSVAHAESYAGDPDAQLDLASGQRSARGRMDRLDVDLVDLFPRIGNAHPAMIGVQLGYRWLPELTTGVYVDAALFGAAPQASDPCHQGEDCYSRHVRFGAFGQMHFGPTSFVDPWVTLAAGGSTSQRLGADVSAMLGLDLRLGDAVAIGPIVTRTQSIAGAQPSWNALGVHLLFTL